MFVKKNLARDRRASVVSLPSLQVEFDDPHEDPTYILPLFRTAH